MIVGVLMDIARLKGVESLEPGTPIYPADLDAAAPLAVDGATGSPVNPIAMF